MEADPSAYLEIKWVMVQEFSKKILRFLKFKKKKLFFSVGWKSKKLIYDVLIKFMYLRMIPSETTVVY